MARSVMYDPGSTEAQSSWIVGLTEICNRMSGILNMDTDSFDDLTLPELFISINDRYRIYQAPLGNKVWLQQPAPIIKKNGTPITPSADGFEIDYLGGSIIFNDEYRCTEGDVITASATYVVDKSLALDALSKKIEDLAIKTGNYFRGSFDTLDDLKAEVEIGEPGDYAIIQNENTIYIWSEQEGDWTNVSAEVDLSNYLEKDQINALLSQKQDNIVAVADTLKADDYYYGGSKTWVRIFDKVLATALTGLAATDSSTLSETDTLLEALGKLQAQITANLHAIIGNSEPTTSLAGEIGQDYVDKSSGKKYHLVRIDGSNYIWEQYISASELNAVDTKLTQSISSTDTSLRQYVDTSIQSAIQNSWKASY